MSTLHNTINSLASEFAHSLLKALRAASLQEIIAETHHKLPSVKGSKKGGRLHRRTAKDITSVASQIVALLKTHKKGLRAEEIRTKLRIQRRELPRPLAEALHKKLVTKRGVKRATTYFHK